MGSKFIDIYVADPDQAHAAVRGDRPELFAAMFAGDDPPAAMSCRYRAGIATAASRTAS